MEWLLQYQDFVYYLAIGIIAVGLFQNLVYILQIPFAWRELREHSQFQDTQASWDILTSRSNLLPISILIPAYNESKNIIDSVNSLLSLHYPDFKLIIINDGSKDDTLDQLKSYFDLQPTLRASNSEVFRHAPIRQVYSSPAFSDIIVIDKANGGKADAINAGLASCHTPLFCVMDADSILEPTALINAVRPFIESTNNVVAVGGTVGIANGCEIKNGQVTRFGLPKKFLPRIQVVEYTRAFLMSRLANSRSGTLTLISGAFGIFRHDIVSQVGGFDNTTVGEDMEMVIRLHHHLKAQGVDYEMRYVPDPVCWTEAPETLDILSKQRIRWQRGALECLWRHKTMIFNPKYGRLGMVSLPIVFIIDVIGPIVEFLGYLLIPFFVLTGMLNIHFLFAYMALVFLFGVFLSTIAVLLEQTELERFEKPIDLLRLIIAAFLENFGYRQICNWWRIKGLWRHLMGNKSVWEPMERVGFLNTAD